MAVNYDDFFKNFKNMDAYAQKIGHAQPQESARERVLRCEEEYRMAAEAALECLNDLLLSHPENRLSEIPHKVRIYHSEIWVTGFRVSRRISRKTRNPERYIEDLKTLLDDIDNRGTPLDIRQELADFFKNYFTAGIGYFEDNPAYDAFKAYVEDKLRS
jgi:hypothetical protein